MTKIQELTDKIYKEGIEKAKKEHDTIVEKAKKEADEIIKSAKQKEKEIIEQANKKADEIKDNINTEIQLAAKQSISKIKQQIANIVTSKQVENPVKTAFKDDEFIKQMILEVLKNWDINNLQSLELILPEEKEADINNFFNNKAKELLDKGLEINFSQNIKSGFKIINQNKNYLISFTEQDFVNYFKKQLKDKTKKMLFS